MMTLSTKRRNALYAAIHRVIIDTRIVLKDQIPAKADYQLAQMEHTLWKEIRLALGDTDRSVPVTQMKPAMDN